MKQSSFRNATKAIKDFWQVKVNYKKSPHRKVATNLLIKKSSIESSPYILSFLTAAVLFLIKSFFQPGQDSDFTRPWAGQPGTLLYTWLFVVVLQSSSKSSLGPNEKSELTLRLPLVIIKELDLYHAPFLMQHREILFSTGWAFVQLCAPQFLGGCDIPCPCPAQLCRSSSHLPEKLWGVHLKHFHF